LVASFNEKMKILSMEAKGRSSANSLREQKNEHPYSLLPKARIKPG
jgi:hypothetical protein